MKYYILRRQDVDELQTLVEKWVNDDGWEIQGGPFVVEEKKIDPRPRAGGSYTMRLYCQCVIKGK